MTFKDLPSRGKLAALLLCFFLLGSTGGDHLNFDEKRELWKSAPLGEQKKIASHYRDWKPLAEEKKKVLAQRWKKMERHGQWGKKIRENHRRFHQMPRRKRWHLKRRYRFYRHKLRKIMDNMPLEKQAELESLPLRERNQKLREIFRAHVERKKKKILHVLSPELKKTLTQTRGPEAFRLWRHTFLTARYRGVKWMKKNPQEVKEILSLSRWNFKKQVHLWRKEKIIHQLEKLSHEEKKKVFDRIRPLLSKSANLSQVIEKLKKEGDYRSEKRLLHSIWRSLKHPQRPPAFHKHTRKCRHKGPHRHWHRRKKRKKWYQWRDWNKDKHWPKGKRKKWRKKIQNQEQ